jgi:dihydroorotase
MTLLRGGSVFDPASGAFTTRDVYMRDGKITGQFDASEVIDCTGLLVSPGLVDLCGSVISKDDVAAALRAGFTTVVQGVDHQGVIESSGAMRDLISEPTFGLTRLLPAPLTKGLGGTEPGEIGSLIDAGAALVSSGSAVVADARVLWHALMYAAPFEVPVVLRPGVADLERGAVAWDGARAVRLGLPCMPVEAEALGVHRAASLARAAGIAVHLHPIATRAGVRALRELGPDSPVTASTEAIRLVLDASAVEESGYDGRTRAWPPLGDEADREGLVEAVKLGLVTAVATGNRPRPPHAWQCEFQLAQPGWSSLAVSLAATLTALGPAAALAAMTRGPAAALGRAIPTLEIGERADVVVIDPALSASTMDAPPTCGDLKGIVVDTWADGARAGCLSA